jgi:hypothetical protein
VTGRLLNVAAAAITFFPPIVWVLLVFAVVATAAIALTVWSFGHELEARVAPAEGPATPSAAPVGKCVCGELLTHGWDIHWAQARSRGEGADVHRIAGAWTADLGAAQ